MAVRETERRLPSGFGPDDLGQSIAASDGRCFLISFATAPVVVGRDNEYVVLVTDAALAGVADTFEWTFTENGAVARVDSTKHGMGLYRPTSEGALDVAVRVLDAGLTEQAQLTLHQDVVLPSAELEAMIAEAQNGAGPGVGDPVVLRELINEHSRYYQQVSLSSPETGDGFVRFVFNMVLSGASRQPASERRGHLEQLAASVTGPPEAFARLSATGAGVCQLRLALLAMVLPSAPGGSPFLPFVELPETGPRHDFADESLRKTLSELGQDAKVDLFNIARFPKSNIVACGRLVEALRNRYFGTTNFNDVLTGMSGTRAHWIVRHFNDGPLETT